MGLLIKLWLIKKPEFLFLIMINADYQLLKLYISINNKNRLKTGLITKNVVENT